MRTGRTAKWSTLRNCWHPKLTESSEELNPDHVPPSEQKKRMSQMWNSGRPQTNGASCEGVLTKGLEGKVEN